MPLRRILFATILAASCSPPGADREPADKAGSDREIVLTADSSSGCSYLWNGNPADLEGIGRNSMAAIERAIEDVGGVQNISDETMPLVHLEAAADVPYTCTGPALRQLERSGLVNVLVKPTGKSGLRAKFFFEPEPAGPFVIVRLGRDGMSWNGEPVDRNGLRERALTESHTRPPAELVVAPGEDSPFAALHDALSATRQGGMDAYLSGCAGTSGPVRDRPIC